MKIKRRYLNKSQRCKDTTVDIVVSIVVVVILALILWLTYILPIKIAPLSKEWAKVTTFFMFIVFVAVFIIFGCWVIRKTRFNIISFCVLGFGFFFSYLSYRKDICWEQISWDPTIFGIAITTLALGVAFLTLFYTLASEARAIDKITRDSNSKMQEIITEMQMIDKIVKDMNNKMQQLNIKVQMMDKTTKDLDSKIQRLDTKIQMLIDKRQEKQI